MSEEFLDFTIDDIKAISENEEEKGYAGLELSLYEKVYLYKNQEIDPLLVESIAPISEAEASIFENVRFVGSQRYYVEDLTIRNYSLENTTPYQINLLGHVIEEGSWGDLLCRTVSLLLELYPNKIVNIYDFRCPWTKSAMFSKDKKTNFKSIANDLYINCNHTALHSCWFLQEILDYFSVDKSSVLFLLHRPSSVEPKEVQNYIKERFIRGFVYYLITQKGRELEQANKVVNIVNKYLNTILRTISKSYNDFFLFDSNVLLAGYSKKVKEKINTSLQYGEKEKKLLNKYLNFLCEYYKL